MKKTLASLFLTGLFLTACGGGATTSTVSTKPADQFLDNNIFAEATSSGNLKRCSDILDATLKTSCEQVIGDNIATKAALDSLDKSMCGKVSNARYKNECETQVDSKIEAKNADKSRLSIEQSAVDKGDASICDAATPDQKPICKYNVLANQAIQKKDPSLCDGIGLKDLVDECKKGVQK